MNIPASSRKKALILVDVQPAFLNERSAHLPSRITELIKNIPYDAYVNALFHTEEGSVWEKQQNWTCPKDENMVTIPVVRDALIGKKTLEVLKETASVFKGAQNVAAYLKEEGIEEVHIVGVDSDNCVLATAYEAFDYGFVTYVLEECCDTSAPDDAFNQSAFSILRRENMTNNSCLDPVSVVELP